MVYAEYDWVEDTCVFVDIEFGQPTSAKMLLNILHNIHTDDCFSASLADTRGIFELAKILGLDHTILRFWFSIWLTNQDLDFIEPHILEEFRTFGQKVGHPMGDAYLDMLIKGDQAISKAIIAFPPVFTKSYRQKSATTSLGRTINPNEYESLGFSPAFMRHFGLPVDYWSDYKRLMTTPFHAELVPKIKTWEKLNQYNFLRFAGTVDEKCSRFHSDLGPVWGDHMEAGWAQMIMDIYINDVLPSAQMSEPSFREQAHHELRMNFRKRTQPHSKIPPCWVKKMGKFGGTEQFIKKTKRGCDELPVHMQLARPDSNREIALNLDLEDIGRMLEGLEMGAEDKDMNTEDAMFSVVQKLRVN